MGQICGKEKKIGVPKAPKEDNVEGVHNPTGIQSERVTSLVNENVSQEVKEGLVNTFENADVVEEANAKPVKEEQESKSREGNNVAGEMAKEIKVLEDEGGPLDNLKEHKDVKEQQDEKSNEVNAAGEKDKKRVLEDEGGLLDNLKEALLDNLEESTKNLSEEKSTGIKEEYTSTPQNSIREAPPTLINNDEITKIDVVDKIEAPEAEKQTDDSVLFFGGGDPNIPSDKVTDLVTNYIDKVEEENDDNIDPSFTVVEKAEADCPNDDVKDMKGNN